MFKKNVRTFDLAFLNFLVFLGILGKNPRAHNLACACRFDYAHTGKFMRAHKLAQKL